MSIRIVSHLIAFMLMVLGAAAAACWGISIHFGDPLTAQQGLLYSSGIMFGFGALLALFTRGSNDLSRRDGFGIVTFGWLAASIFGALPYILSGVIPSPAAAVFETMSGFTTTGASVLSNLEEVPRGVMFWRALTHLFGGMGVLILCVAILPFLGVGGMQIYRAEVPGPSKDRLTPRIATTAKLLWGVYILMCAVEAVLLCMGGMDWFDSLCHTFATLATGGFSTRSASVAAYDSVYIETIITFFMFLAGANFALHYRALTGKVNAYFKDPEFLCYLFIWLGASLLLTLNVWGTTYASVWDALRNSFFTSTSIMTTTGFCTADFDLWPDASRLLLILLMFIGGCAGSTGGGMKVVRIMIGIKKVFRELTLFMRPKSVLSVKLGGKPVEQSAVSHMAAFLLMFMLLFGAFSVVMTFYTPDLETAFSSVIATMGNIGPGLAAVGATQNYAEIAPSGQVILTICMLLGRLELYTVLIVLLPGFWKK
ncbi:TrkH family potassium uptake protein [Verrucomicrobiota bacterium]